MPHCVQSEHSNGDEDESTVELLAGEGVSGVQGDDGEDDEEYEGGDAGDDLYDGEDPDRRQRISVLCEVSGEVETGGLVAERTAGHTEREERRVIMKLTSRYNRPQYYLQQQVNLLVFSDQAFLPSSLELHYLLHILPPPLRC